MPFQPFYNDIQLDDKVWFGKHKGCYIWQVIERDQQYVEWLIENCNNFYLSESAHQYLVEQETKPYGIDFKAILRLCSSQKVLMTWFNIFRDEVLASEELKQLFKQRENELKAKNTTV